MHTWIHKPQAILCAPSCLHCPHCHCHLPAQLPLPAQLQFATASIVAILHCNRLAIAQPKTCTANNLPSSSNVVAHRPSADRHTPRTLPSLRRPPSGASVSARPPQQRSQVRSYRSAVPSPQPADQAQLSPIRHRRFAQSLPLSRTESALPEPLQQPTILLLPLSPRAHSRATRSPRFARRRGQDFARRAGQPPGPSALAGEQYLPAFPTGPIPPRGHRALHRRSSDPRTTRRLGADPHRAASSAATDP